MAADGREQTPKAVWTGEEFTMERLILALSLTFVFISQAFAIIREQMADTSTTARTNRRVRGR